METAESGIHIITNENMMLGGISQVEVDGVTILNTDEPTHSGHTNDRDRTVIIHHENDDMTVIDHDSDISQLHVEAIDPSASNVDHQLINALAEAEQQHISSQRLEHHSCGEGSGEVSVSSTSATTSARRHHHNTRGKICRLTRWQLEDEESRPKNKARKTATSGDETENLPPIRISVLNGIDSLYACKQPQCHRKFRTRSGLLKHMRAVHPYTKTKTAEKKINCRSGCNAAFVTLSEFCTHLKQVHDIPLSTEHITFSGIADFQLWKTSYERQTNSWFVKHRGFFRKDKKVEYLYCNRSGRVLSKGNGKRKAKAQGSSKIGDFCTASMKVQFLRDGRVTVDVCHTHYGHKADLVHIRIPQEDKAAISDKLKQGFTVDQVLDTIRSSAADENLSRIHLTHRRDIYNLSKKSGKEDEGGGEEGGDDFMAGDGNTVSGTTGEVVHIATDNGVQAYVIVQQPEGGTDSTDGQHSLIQVDQLGNIQLVTAGRPEDGPAGCAAALQQQSEVLAAADRVVQSTVEDQVKSEQDHLVRRLQHLAMLVPHLASLDHCRTVDQHVKQLEQTVDGMLKDVGKQ